MIVTKSRGYFVRATGTATTGPHRSGIILTQSSSSRLLPCRIRKRTSRDIKDTRVRTCARGGRRFIIPENSADRMEKPIFYLCASPYFLSDISFLSSSTRPLRPAHFFCHRINAFTLAKLLISKSFNSTQRIESCNIIQHCSCNTEYKFISIVI